MYVVSVTEFSEHVVQVAFIYLKPNILVWFFGPCSLSMIMILVHMLFEWMRVINPLLPRWGTRPEKARFSECLVLPYIGTWLSYGDWYRADS